MHQLYVKPPRILTAVRAAALLAVCLGAISVGQANGPVLLFHDGSVPADRHAPAWTAANSARSTVIDVDSVDAFVTELFRGGWSRVVVLAHFNAPHDILAAALVDYADENPVGLEVQLLLFHDNSPVPGLVVCNWSYGSTSTAYAWLDNDDPAAGNAVSTPGYTYPALAGLRFRNMNPAAFGTIARGAPSSGQRRGISEDPCLQCQLDYDNAIVICDDTRTERVGVCDGLYGPGAQPPHTQNPTLYASCIGGANTSHTNCVKDAGTDFDLCRPFHNCGGGGKK